MTISIEEFYLNNSLDPNFNHHYYAYKYSGTKDFYQPYCSQNNIDDKHRLFFHYSIYSQERYKIHEYVQNLNNINIKNPPQDLPETKTNHRVSYCITCCNRAWQIKKTLPKNLHALRIDEQIVIVDYSSEDDLDSWLTNNYSTVIGDRIKYIRVFNQKYYHCSIAKNIAHYYADAEFVVNLDCDNYLIGMRDILENQVKHQNSKFVLHMGVLENDFNYSQKQKIGYEGTFGRIAFNKADFIAIAGYDESLFPIAYQDSDIILRAIASGYKYINIPLLTKAITNNKTDTVYIDAKQQEYVWSECHKINQQLSEVNICTNKLIATNIYKKIPCSINSTTLDSITYSNTTYTGCPIVNSTTNNQIFIDYDLKDKICLICNIYSAFDRYKDLLPHFLKHYSNLGVDHIIFICDISIKNYIQSTFEYKNIIYLIKDDSSLFLPKGQTGQNDSNRINMVKNQINSWYVPADLDEFHIIEPFESFAELKQDCDLTHAYFVKSIMVDRVAHGDHIPANIDLKIKIDDQFPVKKDITTTIMEAHTDKCILAHPDIDIGPGHHNIINNHNQYASYKKTFFTNHYKWFGDVFKIEQFKMNERKKTGLMYYQEQQRLLEKNPFEKRVIFTIIDNTYKKEAFISLRSAMKYNKYCDYKAIVIHDTTNSINTSLDKCIIKNISFEKYISIEEPIYQKYKHDKNSLRWSLKPVLISKLLEEYDKVIYIDSDIFFINNWRFLFNEIEGVLLTKHNRSIVPNGQEYFNNFTNGFFNAGFIGASKTGLDAINWWKSAVLWKCEKNVEEGLFDDQKYLDIMALEFNNTVKICNSKGCNIANWNSNVIETYVNNNKWFIKQDNSPVIFLHLTKSAYQSSEPILKYYTQQFLHRKNKYDKFNSLFT